MPRMIRELQITEADLLTCNISTFSRLFSRATLPPSEAKELRSSVVLTSAWCDADSRPNYLIPEWRRFVEALIVALPHFSYFHVALEQTYFGFVLSALPEDAIRAEGGGLVLRDPRLMVAKLVALMKPVQIYCQEIFDDSEPVILDLLRPFPGTVTSVVRAAL